jgi:inhibitor of cysteine peptidase
VKRKLSIAFVALAVVAVALLAADGSSVRAQAQPVASIALPGPGVTKDLYSGCNNITLTFADGTTSATVIQAVTPAGTVQSIWRYNPADKKWEGYSPAFPEVGTLLTVDFLDVVWICISGSSPPTDGEPLTLSEEDSGSTVEMQVGDTMEVVLEGNPTTGFTWETEAVDAAILNQLGEPEFESDSELVGSGGTFTFRFEAVASGQTVLTLVYHRPWETAVPPASTFEVTVIVQ